MKSKKKSIGGLAVLTAIAASLCCIIPVIAFVAGLGGLASTFSWLEPFRPFLIGITLAVLGFAWFQMLRPKKDIECCEDDKKPFLQTKAFLVMISLFSGMMLTFPYYSQLFYPDVESKTVSEKIENRSTLNLNISGMTCPGCEEHIAGAVNRIDGIQEVEANFKKGMAIVRFDSSITNNIEIIQAINSTGYRVID